MASIKTSFQDPSQLASAIKTTESAFSLDYTVAVGQSVFNRVNYGVYQYTYTSPSQLKIRFSSGDTAEIYGSNLLGNSYQISRLDYHFTNGHNVSLYGSVNGSSSGITSGYVTQVSMAHGPYGAISVYGSFDVARVGGTVSKVVWDINGVHLEEVGQLQVSVWESGGYYQASHSGVFTSGLITSNGFSLQASGGNVDSNTPAASAMQAILAGNDTVTSGGASGAPVGLWGGAGNDQLVGGSSVDTAYFAGRRGEYNLSKVLNGYQVADKIAGRDGTDTVKNSEVLQFADMKVDLSMGSKAATISASDLKTLEELYVGFFNRIPEAAGLAGWINQIKNGTTLKAVADQFYNSGVLFGVYDKNMSETDFIAKIYANVLGRVGATAPSNDEIAQWQNWLHAGANTKGAMVLEMLKISHGLYTGHPDYGWVVDLLDNKAEVANYFAVQQGLSYNTPQENIDHGTAIAAAITPDSTVAAITLIGVNEFSV